MEAEEDTIDRKCRDDKPNRKRARAAESEVGPEVMTGPQSFMPLYSYSEWIESGSLTKNLTLAINLPSGLFDSANSVRVVDGEYLEMRAAWPQALVDVEILHKFWLDRPVVEGGLERYHPRIVGFEKTMKEKRDHMHEGLKSTVNTLCHFWWKKS